MAFYRRRFTRRTLRYRPRRRRFVRGTITRRRRVFRRSFRLRPELKKNDFVITGATASNQGEVFGHANQIAQGTGMTNRVGRQVLAKYLNVSGTVRLEGGGPLTQLHSNVRIIVFIDRQQIMGEEPVLFDGASTGNIGVLESLVASTVNAPQARLEKDSVGRFSVLRSFVLTLNPTTTLRKFSMRIRLNNVMRYADSGQGFIQKNGIYIGVVGDSAGLPETLPQVNFTGRLSYLDN